MKILCVIDHFGSGGAQRQLVELACALKERQHAVETFIYYPEYDFFRNRIAENGILVHEYSKPAGSSIGLLRRLCQVISAGQYHVVLSYLNTPNLYAELSMMISRSTPLVVSERNTRHDDRSRVHAALYRNMHALAKRVVVNSFAHKQWLENRHPWLRKKVECIYNGFRVDQFNQDPLPLDDKRELRLLAVGRVAPQKNVTGLIEACGLFHRRHGWSPFVTWVGRRGDSCAP